MTTVTDEEQALLAIKLQDNVRQLIRDEVKSHLQDFGSGSELGYALSSTLVYTLAVRLTQEPQFVEAVRFAMKRIVEKY